LLAVAALCRISCFAAPISHAQPLRYGDAWFPALLALVDENFEDTQAGAVMET
jgi:hypothetical protein